MCRLTSVRYLATPLQLRYETIITAFEDEAQLQQRVSSAWRGLRRPAAALMSAFLLRVMVVISKIQLDSR